MSRERLVELVGEEVTALVEAVTEKKTNAIGFPRSWESRKTDYISVLRNGPVEAMAISLADKLHNLWTMNQTLENGINPFKVGRGRTPLSRGPGQQIWFVEEVLATSEQYDDPKIKRARVAVEEQLNVFREATVGM